MPHHGFEGFKRNTLPFLRELGENNNRDWFNDNKSRYENLVLEPALAFITAMQPRLHSISPHFEAEPKRSGGSLMRIYRDIRFSADKSPYKTNIGIQFRHQLGKDVHAPGFYVHIDPESVFIGIGLWHPPSPALVAIRRRIADEPQLWTRARDDKRFSELFELGGESLKRAPQGFDDSHPLITDLKRKDFIAAQSLRKSSIYDESFLDSATLSFRAARPFMSFLCEALDVPF